MTNQETPKFRIRGHHIVLSSLLLFCVGASIGWYLSKSTTPKRVFSSATMSIRQTLPEYPLISPLLLSENSALRNLPIYQKLHDDIDTYISNSVATKKATSVSYYFRNLTTGEYVGVNEDDAYSPSSMLKVAVLETYLQNAEYDASLLSKNFIVSKAGPNLDEEQYFKPAEPVILGKTYSASDLINRMIMDSDNNAAAVLLNEVGHDQLNNYYKTLKMPVVDSANDGIIDYMSPEMYSRVFRVLYNSSYLVPDFSEQALDLLSKTSFTQGIVAGVPASTTVAHKFGEKSIVSGLPSKTIRELHDCGIVYYPSHPYLVCIMTRGDNFQNLEEVIQTISKTTWADFASMNGKR
jgi:beta-lactamase class A